MIAVRPATPTDYLAMADLLYAAEFDAHGQQLVRAYDDDCLVDDGWFVAVAGEEIVGTAHAELAIDYSDLITDLGFHPPHTFISAIVVGGAHRRRGVGRVLLKGVAIAGAVEGSSFLALIPAPRDENGNDPVSFFRRCGLKPLEPEGEDMPARYGIAMRELANSG